jgi:integrase
VVFPSRSDEVIVGYPNLRAKIAKLGDLPADITPHTLRHSFASLAADLGYNEHRDGAVVWDGQVHADHPVTQ